VNRPGVAHQHSNELQKALLLRHIGWE
jgi:hypothetical protein